VRVKCILGQFPSLQRSLRRPLRAFAPGPLLWLVGRRACQLLDLPPRRGAGSCEWKTSTSPGCSRRGDASAPARSLRSCGTGPSSARARGKIYEEALRELNSHSYLAPARAGARGSALATTLAHLSGNCRGASSRQGATGDSHSHSVEIHRFTDRDRARSSKSVEREVELVAAARRTAPSRISASSRAKRDRRGARRRPARRPQAPSSARVLLGLATPRTSRPVCDNAPAKAVQADACARTRCRANIPTGIGISRPAGTGGIAGKELLEWLVLNWTPSACRRYAALPLLLRHDHRSERPQHKDERRVSGQPGCSPRTACR